jgi:hypothetical protein
MCLVESLGGKGGRAVPSRAPDGVVELHCETAAQEFALGVKTDEATGCGRNGGWGGGGGKEVVG